MNLRTLGTAVAATAMIFAFPATVAFAEGETEPPSNYQPREYCAITANPSSLQAGGTTQVSLVDAPNADVDLSVTSVKGSVPDSAIQIAGKQTAVKKADAEGKASFSVTLTEPGDYILDASMVTGQFCGLTVKVSPKDTVVDAAEDEEAGLAGNAAAAVLANTGVTTLPYVAAAAALVGTGAIAVVASRRRRNNS